MLSALPEYSRGRGSSSSLEMLTQPATSRLSGDGHRQGKLVCQRSRYNYFSFTLLNCWWDISLYTWGRAGGQANPPDLFIAETSLFSETVPNNEILGQSVKLGNVFLRHLLLFLPSALSVPHERRGCQEEGVRLITDTWLKNVAAPQPVLMGRW